MRDGYPEGHQAYSACLEVEQDILQVIIPLEHCAELITTIEERLAYFAKKNSRSAVIDHLKGMKNELKLQMDEQSEQNAMA